MKTPKKMKLDKISQPQNESQKTQSKESLKLMVWIWEMMAKMYGNRWTSSYGDQIDPGRIWEASLKGISREKIKNGLNKLAINGDAWPPSAPEFRKLCIDGDEHWEHKKMRLIDEQNEKNLIEKKDKALTKAEGKIRLQAMREQLKI